MRGKAVDSDEEAEFEAERGADDVDMDGDEEEEEEDQDEYEQDGFIVDDVEEEGEDEVKQESDEEYHRKRKKKKRDSGKNFVLDEDDYELLQDNNITGFRRPQPNSKFKRLKKAGRDNEVERSVFSDEDGFGGNRLGGRSAEEKLKRSLFGDDELMPLEDIAEEGDPSDEDGNIIGEDDEMADFIVDEDVDETGALVRKKRLTKKKLRQAPGVSSSALQEAHDIFGDVDELLMLRKQTLASVDDGLGEKRLENDFEPFIVSEKYMTQKDEIIRETDIPERIQMSEDITGPPPGDDKSIEEETTWIYNQLSGGAISPLVGYDQVVKEINKEEIGNVLTMMHVQKLDVSFICMYRKELCGSLLKDLDDNMLDGDEMPKMKWHKLLWVVETLDRKWLLLQKRKNALHSYYDKRFEEEVLRVDDEVKLSLRRQIFKSVIAALSDANSEREVDDIDAKFNLHFPPGEIDTDHGHFRRPKRKSLYSICYNAGMWKIANKFGVNSELFGLLLSLEKIKDEVEDRKEALEELAANYTCSMFETPQDVLKGARHMAAVEIGCEPNVKKHVRNIFMEKAVVSTSPTSEGNLAIDTYHHLAGVKWLRNKPLSEFVDGQWLLIQKGEEEKLLKVTVNLPEEVQKKILSNASECYLSDFVSRSAQIWNEQRSMILEDSFLTYIFPMMEKEARSLLTSRAKNWLRMEYGRQLWNRVSIAPFKRKDVANDLEYGSEARVMACCWGPGKPPTTVVMLDSSGDMVDVLYAGSISVRSQGVTDQQRKRNDHQRVLKFMTDHQPHAVCVGAANMACRQLKDDIYEVIFKIVEDHPKDVGQDLEHMSIVFGDESLPRLYENSRVSDDQLPGQPGIVKRAVALGRYLQNPLAMVATLCGPGKEILSWKLCPLQHFLTPDEKYEVVEQVMVDATNQVGVDINLAASHDWLFSPMQFVSGLGPRKASALQRAFVRAGSIFNRKEIPMGKMLRKKVFINSVGFLRVRRSGAAAASSHIMDLLDDTRIHPESYELAKGLAKDIYNEDVPNGANDMDEDIREMAIEHVRDNPNMLNALVIDEYAKSIFNRYKANKKETLSLIKMELLHGFQDWRTPFKEPDAEEEFTMLSGETDDTISDGRIVQVTVRYVQENRIICSFDSGLKGMISPDDFSDDGYDPEKVHEGDILTCKIKHVNKNRLVVYLTSKASDLRRRPSSNNNHDPYYHEDGINLQSRMEKAQKVKQLAMKHFRPRMIVHPCFQNLTADEAMAYLSDKDFGQSIMRPSSKGPSFLTLTLKIYDGVYAHKEIVEGGKDLTDLTSLLRLGKTLTIDKDIFEDLDEVMDRYVDPLVTHLKNMLAYRKFRKGTKTEVDDQLRAEKAANPMRIVYCFGISHEYPGTFILSFIRSSTPHHEYIGLYPNGFRFRKRNFNDINHLVSYFQKNIDKPLLDVNPSLQTLAAMVPMASSGGGSRGSASADSNDGWRDTANFNGEGLRTGDRYDSESAHPSGIPHPGRGRGRGCGRGRGRGRGRNSDNSTTEWRSSANKSMSNGGGSWGARGNAGGSDDKGTDGWGETGNDNTNCIWGGRNSGDKGGWGGNNTENNAGGDWGRTSADGGDDKWAEASSKKGWSVNGGSTGDWGTGGSDGWGGKNSGCNNVGGDWGGGSGGGRNWAEASNSTGWNGGSRFGNQGAEGNCGDKTGWGIGKDSTGSGSGQGRNNGGRGSWGTGGNGHGRGGSSGGRGTRGNGRGRSGNNRLVINDAGDWGSGSTARGGDKWGSGTNQGWSEGGGRGAGGTDTENHGGSNRAASNDGGRGWGSGITAEGGDKWTGSGSKQGWSKGGDGSHGWEERSNAGGSASKGSGGWGEVNDTTGFDGVGNSSSKGSCGSGGDGWGGKNSQYSKGEGEWGSGSAEGENGKWAGSSSNKRGGSADGSWKTWENAGGSGGWGSEGKGSGSCWGGNNGGASKQEKDSGSGPAVGGNDKHAGCGSNKQGWDEVGGSKGDQVDGGSGAGWGANNSQVGKGGRDWGSSSADGGTDKWAGISSSKKGWNDGGNGGGSWRGEANDGNNQGKGSGGWGGKDGADSKNQGGWGNGGNDGNSKGAGGDATGSWGKGQAGGWGANNGHDSKGGKDWGSGFAAGGAEKWAGDSSSSKQGWNDGGSAGGRWREEVNAGSSQGKGSDGWGGKDGGNNKSQGGWGNGGSSRDSRSNNGNDNDSWGAGGNTSGSWGKGSGGWAD